MKPSNIDQIKTNSVLFCPSPMHEHGLWSKEQEFD